MKKDGNITVAVAGNPNVGKSTLFNALTGMKQHTGNWPGKTVGRTEGRIKGTNGKYRLIDIPGTYSLIAHSKEEEIARDYICFGEPEIVIAVCDATCLERNLNLVYQILEVHKNVIVCVNLMDEAKRKGIEVDINRLSHELGVPVVKSVARKKNSLKNLVEKVEDYTPPANEYLKIKYPLVLAEAMAKIEKVLSEKLKPKLNHRWLALQLLCGDENLLDKVSEYYKFDILKDEKIMDATESALKDLEMEGVKRENIKDMAVSSILKSAEKTAEKCVDNRFGYSKKDRLFDKIFTGKISGYGAMFCLLALCLWITVTGANYLSEGLSFLFAEFEKLIIKCLDFLGVSALWKDIIIEGIYRVPSWVISVMLPPMAIFFPLFTILEDAGYLPRVAFNLDRPFGRCKSCGKQALTMCMGLGCNAAGVTGCRIIDSERERLLAILTNSFVPCNGRFPTIIALISMFFVVSDGGTSGVVSSACLTLVIIFAVVMTLWATRFLSATLLKGVPSAYTLEMPPYRRPQIGKVIVRSLLDRTLFVLGRSLISAVPAGIVIFILANITVGDISLLTHIAEFLDPFAQIMGLDGIILLAFILGFPANEIVIPIVIMGYLCENSLSEMPNITQMKELFLNNGWTLNTAICMVIFSLFHWPCATTVLTVKKETGSLKWTAVSVLLPTVTGMVLCIAVTLVFRLL